MRFFRFICLLPLILLRFGMMIIGLFLDEVMNAAHSFLILNECRTDRSSQSRNEKRVQFVRQTNAIWRDDIHQHRFRWYPICAKVGIFFFFKWKITPIILFIAHITDERVYSLLGCILNGHVFYLLVNMWSRQCLLGHQNFPFEVKFDWSKWIFCINSGRTIQHLSV